MLNAILGSNAELIANPEELKSYATEVGPHLAWFSYRRSEIDATVYVALYGWSAPTDFTFGMSHCTIPIASGCMTPAMMKSGT